MLGNMCIVIICFPVYDVINFETGLTFLIKPFSNMTKKLGEKSKYPNNIKGFKLPQTVSDLVVGL